MQDLTPRQTELIKLIIGEYSQTGEPVGSEIIDKKYHLGVSPATIRNEMVELAKKGYLKKQYFSSGRVPTAKAFRSYIKNMMKEESLSTADEVAYKHDIWDYREKVHQLLIRATHSLAKRTRMLAVSATTRGDIYYFGMNYALSQQEFWDIDKARSLFAQFDELGFCNQFFERFKEIEDEILFSFMNEKGDDELASVWGEFKGHNFEGIIGVMGPKRMRYEHIVPNVRNVAHLIESILKENKHI